MAQHEWVLRGYFAICAVAFALLIPHALEMTSLFRPGIGQLTYWTPAWMVLGAGLIALAVRDYAGRYEIALLAPLREHPDVCVELRRLADTHAPLLAQVRTRTRHGRQLRVFDLVALDDTIERQRCPQRGRTGQCKLSDTWTSRNSGMATSRKTASPAETPAAKLRRLQKEARETRKALQQLSDNVLVFLHQHDLAMKQSDSLARGKRLAGLSNALDMANDIVRFGPLGVDFERTTKQPR